MQIMISACLLGLCCRYDGKSKPHPGCLALAREHTLIPVCPEQLGGLATPRMPAERRGERVMTKEDVDVTEAYRRGAAEACRLAELLEIRRAILKARSPSCGVGHIYDGSFTHALIPGDGVAAEALRHIGLELYTEEDLDNWEEERIDTL